MVVKQETERTILLTIGVFSLLAGIVMAIYLWDRPTQLLLHAQSGMPLLRLAEFLGVFGLPLPYIGFALLLLLFWGIVLANTGFSFAERLLPYRALFILTAAIASWLAASGLQSMFGRSRPHLYFEHGVYTFHPFMMASDFTSFPSSHAAVSAAMAAVFSQMFPVYRLTFFLVATLIAASRVAAGYHYLSDAAAGMLLGIAIVGGLERCFDRVGINVRGNRAKWP